VRENLIDPLGYGLGTALGLLALNAAELPSPAKGLNWAKWKGAIWGIYLIDSLTTRIFEDPKQMLEAAKLGVKWGGRVTMYLNAITGGAAIYAIGVEGYCIASCAQNAGRY
jgi:hypothetical protein